MAKYKLKLYIIGYTSTAKKAIKNLYEICELPGVKGIYEPEVVNLLENPKLAESEKILATPVLIRDLPEPLRRIIGDLSDREKVLVGLNICEI